MNKDRLIGGIMIGLVLMIIAMYFINSTSDKKIENENEELKALLNEEREKNEKEEKVATGTSSKERETSNEEIENPDEINANTEIDSYDEFIEDFINTLNIYDDQKTKNEALAAMTSGVAQTYLKENYYILEDGEQIEDNHDHGTHAEGDFEPLEMDMELTSLQSYYTVFNNRIEVIALYRLNTTAGEENFSGNYVLKGTLIEEDGATKFETLDSIVAINDPNASELFLTNSENE